MTWTVDVSLLGSPVVLRQTAGVFLVTFAVVSLFACGLFAVEGDWAGILPTLGVLALVHVGLVWDWCWGRLLSWCCISGTALPWNSR